MIKIICVGKIKEKFYRDALLEYEKRLRKFVKVELIQVDDEKGDHPQVVMQKERDRIQKYIHEKDYLITLEIEGTSLTSLELSKKIDELSQRYPTITFIIGGSYGLHDDIKKQSDFQLSFSKLTFPHQLFRILLLEQIYRSYKILHHEAYHK